MVLCAPGSARRPLERGALRYTPRPRVAGHYFEPTAAARRLIGPRAVDAPGRRWIARGRRLQVILVVSRCHSSQVAFQRAGERKPPTWPNHASALTSLGLRG